MVASGDRVNPCRASCQLIETLLKEDLSRLLELIIQSANLRMSNTITPDDFAFQLRRNKSKLHRLTEFLKKKEMLSNRKTFLDDIEISVDPSLNMDIDHKPWKRRKLANSRHFKILQDADSPSLLFLNSYDSLSWKRIMRADHISEGLTAEEYEYYSNRCQKSFLKTPCPVFPYFSSQLPVTHKLSENCSSIIGYLCHEFVQQLVEDAAAIYRDVVTPDSTPEVACANCRATKNNFQPCLNVFYYQEVIRRFKCKQRKLSLYIL